MFRCIASLAVFFLTTAVTAGTVIDIKAPGMNTRLMMDEQFARVDNAADGSYLLLDRRADQSYLVLPSTQQVMKLDGEGLPDENGIRLVKAKSNKQRIFGFPVERYRLFAGRDYCGDVFASHEAMHELDVEPMLVAVATLIDQQLHAMGPYMAIIDQCSQASMRVLNHADRIGMPLRLYDAEGELLSDIVNIDTRAELKPGVLDFPEDYTLVASASELSPTEHLVQQARRYSPAVDQVYRAFDRYTQPYRSQRSY